MKEVSAAAHVLSVGPHSDCAFTRSSAGSAREQRTVHRARAKLIVTSIAIFVLAFAARLVPVLCSAGLSSYGRYDDGVYYTAADALSFGRVPYRDFILLHPPGLVLLLLPFTLLGRLTSDPTGLAAARVAFMVLGAVSAVLVFRVVRRWGWAQGAIAGLIYALSFVAIYNEQSTLLEPPATVLTLVAILVLYRRTVSNTRAMEIIAGAALGLACTMKIWYAGIFVGLLIVVLLRRELRAALRIAGAGILAAAAVIGPFFALAPQQMWTMVVAEQLGRRSGTLVSRIDRAASVTGADVALVDHPTLIYAVTIVAMLLVLVALVMCLRDRETWLLAGLFIVSGLILFASPSFFFHYGVLFVMPAAIMLPVGLGKLVERRPSRVFRTSVAVACAAAVVVAALPTALRPVGKVFPGALFAAAAPAGCLAADDPAALIQMNRLSTDLEEGCYVPVDVTGASYSSTLARPDNPAFQQWLMHYLMSSRAFVVLRAPSLGLSTAENGMLHGQPILASADGLTLRQGTPVGPAAPPTSSDVHQNTTTTQPRADQTPAPNKPNKTVTKPVRDDDDDHDSGRHHDDHDRDDR